MNLEQKICEAIDLMADGKKESAEKILLLNLLHYKLLM